MRPAVVGHVEWVDFVAVPRLPRPGEILYGREHFAAPGAGGAVAAVELRRLAGEVLLLTALGSDEASARARDELLALGVDVHAARREQPLRRSVALLESHERTIVVLNPELVPHGDDSLPWQRLARCDAVFFAGGDAAAVRAARASRFLVASSRSLRALVDAGVAIDALVASGADPGEVVAPDALDPPPRLVVTTEAGLGGCWRAADGSEGRYEAATALGPAVDAYGCGTCFAAALTFALGEGRRPDDALRFASRSGAAALERRGPY